MPNTPIKSNPTLAQKEAWEKLWRYLLSDNDNPAKTEKPGVTAPGREEKSDNNDCKQ